MTDTFDPSTNHRQHQLHKPSVSNRVDFNEVENDELDADTLRKRREAENGLYRDTMKPIDLDFLSTRQMYTLSAGALQPVSRKNELSAPNGITPTVTQIGRDEIVAVTSVDETMEDFQSTQGSQEAEALANPANLPSLDVLSGQIDRLYLRYEAERSKGGAADIDKLSEIFMEMMGVWSRACARHDYELSLALTDELHGNVKKVQDTFNHIGSILFTVASSLLSIVGGVAQAVGGGVQLNGGSRMISIDKAKQIVKMGGAGGMIGQALHPFGGMFDQRAMMLRTKEEHRKTEASRRRDQHTQNAQQSDSRAKEGVRNVQEHNSIKTRKNSAMMGGGQDA